MLCYSQLHTLITFYAQGKAWHHASDFPSMCGQFSHEKEILSVFFFCLVFFGESNIQLHSVLGRIDKHCTSSITALGIINILEENDRPTSVHVEPI